MAVSWTRHRFSGGTLALDAANTVVYREDPARSFDRFDDPAEIARFAAAASGFLAGELSHRELAVPDPLAIHATVLAIREATDRLFRGAASKGGLDATALPPFLRACADGLEVGACGRGGACGCGAIHGTQAGMIAFEAALAASALALLAEPKYRRIRVCPNCNWLFLDKSRNASRLWCDMAVCGNRSKARRHYQRRKLLQEDHTDA
jgi:predicted RNA-binding Zn ribbon-like protein